MSKSVLILDDDAAFRGLIAGLFKTRGYRTVEATSTDEATALFSSRDTALAIVDYQLPGQDGMSWITKLRDAGRNVPVVFVSAMQCDPKTFNWLRNILKVSLIIKKPVIPEVFLQQVEYLLPEDVKQSLLVQDGVATSQLEPDYDDSALSESALLHQLARLRSKLEIKDALKIAQINYMRELQQTWASLVKGVNDLKTRRDYALLNETVTAAHTLNGTAGSLGLTDVGEAGAKLEHFLRMVELSSDELDQEIIWSEIFRVLADGERAVLAAYQAQETISVSQKSVTKVLLVGQESKYKDAVASVTDAHVEIAESVLGAQNKLKRLRFDAMILDMMSGTRQLMCDLARDVRATIGSSIPIAIVQNPAAKLDDEELTYMGCSEILDSIVTSEKLNASISTMLNAGKSQKHRIVLVDDDDVLCQFVSTILTAHGYQVRTLNHPILALDVINEFKPDLVLLDVIMPGLSGYEVCRMIRETTEWRNIPILFLTGKTSPESRAAAFQAGANDFLTKPVLTDELLARIKPQLDRISFETDRLARDPVTGLLNDHAFLNAASGVLKSAERSDANVTLALFCIDGVDGLRVVEGVEPLRQAVATLGQLVMTHFRTEDLRGRLGYEGYTLLCEGKDKQSLIGALNLLQQDLSTYRFSGARGNFPISFSAGLADTADDGFTYLELLQTAHKRMVDARREHAGAIGIKG